MRRFRTILVSGLVALSPGVAQAGPAMARQNVPIPVVNYAPGAAVSVAAGGASAFNLGGGVSVQTNIDNSKTIDASSNIDVNTTINGSDVAYGLNGANALNVIDNAANFDAGDSAARAAQIEQAYGDAMLHVELGN